MVRIKSSATILDLRQTIYLWFDGYNWTRKIMVLNPYSILNFLTKKIFSDYWIQSGLAYHLLDLIEAKPKDSIELQETRR
ncbi:MAG: hypothetical protein LBF22_09625 [Deltaproteobacteria bacterium]|nr:hypothetical protein [Deltaproteobacteria bacterium]